MNLAVISKNERVFVCLIKTYTYVQYTDELYNEGSFEIQIPTNDESLQYLVFGNYIYFEDGILGIIKGQKDTEDSDINITIYGYLSNHLLTYRSFLLTTKYYDTIGNIVRKMFSDLFVNPVDSKRKISYFKLSSDSEYIPDSSEKVRIQNTGDTLFDVYSEILLPYDLGFELYPVVKSASDVNLEYFEMRFISSVDRTINNKDGNDPVVFSFDLDNLSDLEYEEDCREYCNVAIVASEGTGEERNIVEVGDTNASGVDRIELYVDARDLQSGSDESGEQALSDLGGYEFGYTEDGSPGYKDPKSDNFIPLYGFNILNSSGTKMNQRSNLQFVNLNVVDDGTNDKTIIYGYVPKIGTVKTLSPGSDATVEVKIEGNDAKLSFGIPKGDKGDPGEQGSKGDKGDKGDKGEDGATITYGNVDLDAGVTQLTTGTFYFKYD